MYLYFTILLFLLYLYNNNSPKILACNDMTMLEPDLPTACASANRLLVLK